VKRVALTLAAVAGLGALGWVLHRRLRWLEDRQLPWRTQRLEETCGWIDDALVHGRTDLWTPEFREAMGELIAAAKRQMEAETRGTDGAA
jgi:hypothetical protein